MTETPLPVGAIVTYHGGHSEDWDKRWIVRGHYEPRKGTPDPEVNYPDGVAYEIWPEGVPHKFGNRMHSVTQVRRQSLTDTGERVPLLADVDPEYRKSVVAESGKLHRQAYEQHYANLDSERRRFDRELEELGNLLQLRLSALSEHKDS